MVHLMRIKPTILQFEVSKQHLAADSLQNAFKSCKHEQKSSRQYWLMSPTTEAKNGLRTSDGGLGTTDSCHCETGGGMHTVEPS